MNVIFIPAHSLLKMWRHDRVKTLELLCYARISSDVNSDFKSFSVVIW
jgi:hypothetical protein